VHSEHSCRHDEEGGSVKEAENVSSHFGNISVPSQAVQRAKPGESGSKMTIPTLSDYMVYVERRMGSASVDMDPELAQSLSDVFTCSTAATDTDLFNFIAYSQGCHALAEACRERGDLSSAGFYHAMGQDLLTKATNALADLMAIGIQQAGVVRH
jgi:hypothetical protein